MHKYLLLGLITMMLSGCLHSDEFYDNEWRDRFEKRHFTTPDFNFDREFTISDFPALLIYIATAPGDMVIAIIDNNMRSVSRFLEIDRKSYAGVLSNLISCVVWFFAWMGWMAYEMHTSPNKQN